MFEHKSDLVNQDVILEPTFIDMYVNDENAFILELPSAEDLVEMENVPKPIFSIKSLVLNANKELSVSLQIEMDSLLTKYDTFSKASDYLKILSNYADLTGDADKSLTYVEQAANIKPSEYLKNELGDKVLASGKEIEALKYFKSLEPIRDPHSLLRLAQYDVLKGDFLTAKKRVQEACELDSSHFGARMFMGALSMWNGQPELAIRNFKIAIEEKPTSSNAHVNLAAAYLRVKETKKALNILRISVALNPYNENAIKTFSDVAHLLKKDQLVLPILEKYIEHDQTSSQIWERLARTEYFIANQENAKDHYLKAYEALQFQNKIKPQSSIFNNLGLVIWKLGDTDRAIRYLNLSIKKGIEEEGGGIMSPLFNVTSLLIAQRKYNEALQIYKRFQGYITDDGTYMPDNLLLQSVVLLEGSKHRSEAANIALEYYPEVKNPEVKLDLLSRIVLFHATYDQNLNIINNVSEDIINLSKNSKATKEIKKRAVNNLIFSLLNMDEIEKAKHLISLLSSEINIDPYATATLGMYHLKSGNIERGSSYYKNAISILDNKIEKDRFKQRFYFELSNAHYLIGDISKGRRFLQRAANEKHGFEYFNKQITKKLISLE